MVHRVVDRRSEIGAIVELADRINNQSGLRRPARGARSFFVKTQNSGWASRRVESRFCFIALYLCSYEYFEQNLYDPSAIMMWAPQGAPGNLLLCEFTVYSNRMLDFYVRTVRTEYSNKLFELFE